MYAGAWTDPPPGVAGQEWQKLDRKGQEAAIARIQQEHAEAQREWEAAARRDFEERWEAEA